jgi:hypothetical protein
MTKKTLIRFGIIWVAFCIGIGIAIVLQAPGWMGY